MISALVRAAADWRWTSPFTAMTRLTRMMMIAMTVIISINVKAAWRGERFIDEGSAGFENCEWKENS